MKFLTTMAFALAMALPAFAMPAYAQDDTDLDMEAAATMYARSCAQCHGRTGRGMASFPSIAGKDADYLAERLELYRAGETVGPNSPLMRPVAAKLSDDDIAQLAAFISASFE